MIKKHKTEECEEKYANFMTKVDVICDICKEEQNYILFHDTTKELDVYITLELENDEYYIDDPKEAHYCINCWED